MKWFIKNEEKEHTVIQRHVGLKNIQILALTFWDIVWSITDWNGVRLDQNVSKCMISNDIFKNFSRDIHLHLPGLDNQD